MSGGIVQIGDIPETTAVSAQDWVLVFQGGEVRKCKPSNMMSPGGRVQVAGAWDQAGNSRMRLQGEMQGTATGFLANYATILMAENLSLTDSGSTINSLYVGHTTTAVDGVAPGIGNRNAIAGVLTHAAATPGTPFDGHHFYTGIFSTVYVTSDDGGTPGAPKGDFFGYGGIVQFQPGLQNMRSICGAEFDVAVREGCTVQEKIGLQIVQVNDDAVQGAVLDVGLLICADATCKDGGNWRHGIAFGRPGGRWSVTGTLIGTYASVNQMVCDVGIDWRSVGFRDAAIYTPGFYVDGFGNIGGKNLVLTGNAIQIGSSTTIPTAGSAGAPGQIVWDSSYLYVCVAANTWKRTLLSSW